MEINDVVVIGAGFSGLTVAEKLSKQGFKVRIVETQDGIGGRTFTKDGWDLGGMWVSPIQTNVFPLCEEYGFRLHEQQIKGNKVLMYHGKRSCYSGLIPPVGLLTVLEIQINIIWRVSWMMESITLDNIWESPNAEKYSKISVLDWFKQICWTEGALQTVHLVAKMLYGKNSSELSLLFFLANCKTAGGLTNLLETRGHAQHATIIGGISQLSDKILDIAVSNGAKLHLSHECTEINQTNDNVEIVCKKSDNSQEKFKAKYVVFAIPPSVQSKITFTPPLSSDRVYTNQNYICGSYSKTIFVYENCFWRELGLSGEVAVLDPSIKFPISAVFDHSGKAPALVIFTTGEEAKQLGLLSEEDRRNTILNHLEIIIQSSKVRNYVSYYEKQWHLDPYTKGCPMDTFGIIPQNNKALCNLKQREGRLIWAGTETAVAWQGYIDGAIESGIRASDECVSLLQGKENNKRKKGKCPIDSQFSIYLLTITLLAVGITKLPFFNKK
eukprot:c17731_g1_i1.p1 GENE.c17731_g1_i1~~c17731_g1_i1.p1  ORF type:complete len:498 (+),score=205.77 c17731_g1_i1:123-1616(+)